MSHPYTCHYCNKITAELHSFQALTPSGRVGFDLYTCTNCGMRYLYKNYEASPTKLSIKNLYDKLWAEVCEREKYPEKFKKEKIEFEKEKERIKNNPAYQEFAKAFKIGLKNNI